MKRNWAYVGLVGLALGLGLGPAFGEAFGPVATSRLPPITGGDVSAPAGSAVHTIQPGAVTASKLGTGAAIGNIGYTPTNKAGDQMTGGLTFAPLGCTSTSGTFDPGGTQELNPTCSGVFASATGTTISTPSVNGSAATTNSAPYTLDMVNIDKSMLVVRGVSTSQTTPETAFAIDWAVLQPQATSLAGNPNPGNFGTQKAAFELHFKCQPGAPGSGQGPASCWGENTEAEYRGSQGQIALAVENEADMAFGYSGTDAFSAHQWFAWGGGSAPVAVGIYMNDQFTNTYTGNVTVSGANVTVTSGNPVSTTLTYIVVIGGTQYRVSSITDTTHFVLMTAPTTQGSTTYSWGAAAANVGMLMTDNGPLAPLNQAIDIQLNTSANIGLSIGGHQQQAINVSGSTAAYSLVSGSGQLLTFGGADATMSFNSGLNALSYVQGGVNLLQVVGGSVPSINLQPAEKLSLNAGTGWAWFYNSSVGAIVLNTTGTSNPFYIDASGDVFASGSVNGSTYVATGSGAGFSATDRTGSGHGILYRTGGVNYLYDDTSGNVLSYAPTTVKVLPTTAATSTTTGAFDVAGGMGVAGALFAGGGETLTGTLLTQAAANYQISMSYNNASGDGFGVIQAAHAGVANTPLQLNPNGGQVTVGAGGLALASGATLVFGTYTAGAATNTGYIAITDAGGTTRHLGVVP